MGIHHSFIVYCSPAGSTRHVAGVLEKKLVALGHEAACLDLGDQKADHRSFLDRMGADDSAFSLFIGSPVYGMHAVPPVTDFIRGLPKTRKGYAVPFITWGGSCSGVALYEMGELLEGKGYRILGGAKIPAVHSMLWLFENPRGQGHPDAGDDKVVESLAANITEKLAEGTPEGIPVSRLACQPDSLHAELMKTSYEEAKSRFQKRNFKEELCSECGTCAEECPAGAITCSPYPEFGEGCFSCFTCMRVCPTGAINADLSMQEKKIAKRASQVGEPACPEIYI